MSTGRYLLFAIVFGVLAFTTSFLWRELRLAHEQVAVLQEKLDTVSETMERMERQAEALNRIVLDWLAGQDRITSDFRRRSIRLEEALRHDQNARDFGDQRIPDGVRKLYTPKDGDNAPAGSVPSGKTGAGTPGRQGS